MSDKARALKERTLAMEIRHAQLNGGTLRDAEAANMAALERLEARKREGKKPAPKPSKPRQFQHREVTKKELADAKVSRRPAPPKKLIAPSCKFCGVCRWCKRFKRSQEILSKGRMGDTSLLPLAMELVGFALAAQQRSDYKDALGTEYPFSRLIGRDKTRAVNAGIEAVCDRSVPLMGAWR